LFAASTEHGDPDDLRRTSCGLCPMRDLGVTADKHSSPAFCVSYFILRRGFQMA
jgi:hypothetical protein